MDISCVALDLLWNDCTLLGFYPNSSSSVSPTEEMLLNCFHLGPCCFSLKFCSNGIQPDHNVSPKHCFPCFQCQIHWVLKMRISLQGDLVPGSLCNLPRTPRLVTGQAAGLLILCLVMGGEDEDHVASVFVSIWVPVDDSTNHCASVFKTGKWGHPWYSTDIL